MSETYVVTLIKYHYGTRYAVEDSELLMHVSVSCERWTTEPQQRRWAKDVAEQLFYTMIEQLIEYPIERNLIHAGRHTDPEVYYGEFCVDDDAENAGYAVSIFRHYFSDEIMDKGGYPDMVKESA